MVTEIELLESTNKKKGVLNGKKRREITDSHSDFNFNLMFE